MKYTDKCNMMNFLQNYSLFYENVIYTLCQEGKQQKMSHCLLITPLV